MKKLLIALTGVSLLALGGCAGITQTAETGKSPTQVAAPTISAEAQAALTQAEADVAAARKQKALWTTAESALKAAQDAAKAGDSAGVLKNAKTASDHAKMGIEQLKYPSTNPFK